jgi:hypothetical protein
VSRTHPRMSFVKRSKLYRGSAWLSGPPHDNAPHVSAFATAQRDVTAPPWRSGITGPGEWGTAAFRSQSVTNGEVGWSADVSAFEALNGRIAPMAVVPGRLAVGQMQTFAQVWR